MSDDLKLGQIIEDGRRAERDAVHVAVVPVTAQAALSPGQHVNADGVTSGQCVGIVDPFLTDLVWPGQRFWLFLFPGSVTGLRHHWSHPAFPDEAPAPVAPSAPASADVAESEAWLREYAAKRNNYDEPAAAFDRLIRGLRTGELFFYGSDLHGLYDLDDADELRFHAERYLGIRIDWGRFSFSCSC